MRGRDTRLWVCAVRGCDGINRRNFLLFCGSNETLQGKLLKLAIKRKIILTMRHDHQPPILHVPWTKINVPISYIKLYKISNTKFFSAIFYDFKANDNRYLDYLDTTFGATFWRQVEFWCCVPCIPIIISVVCSKPYSVLCLLLAEMKLVLVSVTLLQNREPLYILLSTHT